MNRTLLSAMTVICSAIAVSCGSQRRCQNGSMSGNTEEIGTEARAEDEPIVGAWEEIRTTADTLEFDKQGGERTVLCLNYDNWWLNDIQVSGTEKFYHADPGRNNEYLKAKAPGISAEIIRPNTLRVTVDPSGTPSEWLIHLESGNAFTSIKVTRK